MTPRKVSDVLVTIGLIAFIVIMGWVGWLNRAHRVAGLLSKRLDEAERHQRIADYERNRENFLPSAFTNLVVTNRTEWILGWSNRLDGIKGPSVVERFEDGRITGSYTIDYSTNYAVTNAKP